MGLENRSMPTYYEQADGTHGGQPVGEEREQQRQAELSEQAELAGKSNRTALEDRRLAALDRRYGPYNEGTLPVAFRRSSQRVD